MSKGAHANRCDGELLFRELSRLREDELLKTLLFTATGIAPRAADGLDSHAVGRDAKTVIPADREFAALSILESNVGLDPVALLVGHHVSPEGLMTGYRRPGISCLLRVSWFWVGGPGTGAVSRPARLG